jgi:predicted transcriptional regulator
MPTKLAVQEKLFRYRASDTPLGVTRSTALKLSEVLGMDETQVIHYAMRQLADRTLPQYPADDGPISDRTMVKIKKLASPPKTRKVLSSLI